jgi:hypothetical protein
MNKKLLFAAISLAALTACTSDDFESKKIAAEGTSPVQFEVINNNDGFTRASMDGNKVVWSAADGDLFTLYHGAALGALTGYENATYTAKAEEGQAATLTTPTVIKAGGAVMVWPVDTAFRIRPADALTLEIPVVQGQDKDIQYEIPYVSDLIDVEAYAAYSETAAPGVIPTAYKTEGKDRKYKIFMRPMASQLNIKADYAGTDATLATLYTGDDPIDPISVESVDLLTTAGGGTTNFTREIPVKFSAAPAGSQWGTVANNKWNQVTDFNVGGIVAGILPAQGQTDILTTKSLLANNEGCKFLILPQATIADALATDGVADGAVVVNTIYGKVVIAQPGIHGSLYTVPEIGDAWYRYVSPTTGVRPQENKALVAEASGEHVGKHKTTSAPALGMAQTINAFSANTAASGVAQGEPQGAATTRYVKVLLTKLDMTDLHIKNDKQLRDAAKVWKQMGLNSVTVYLDGDATNGDFGMTQKTIETINNINATVGGGKVFQVQPCDVAGEKCNNIIITGGDKIQDMTFIVKNAGTGKKADVRLMSGFNWKWDGEVKIASATTTGINEIKNWGTLDNAEGKILKITDGTNVVDITFVNDSPGKWNITAGRIRVQNDVRNNGTINISKDAQLIEDGAGLGTGNAVFTNNALGLPTRFGGDNRFGKVNNDGVFATLSGGVINNYGLIEHGPTPGNKEAKTFITSNETAAGFITPFAAGTTMKGRINLPYSNKDEDNISISATALPPYEGFISVTVDGDAPTSTLNAATVGKFVNYMIVKSGIDDIGALPATGQVEYLEIDTDHEVYWSVPTPTPLVGLIVLSDVNIKLGTTLSATVTYLGAKDGKNADMYVGGNFNYHVPAIAGDTNWNGYYGATGGNVAEHYITY